jgi:hypothetical protein
MIVSKSYCYKDNSKHFILCGVVQGHGPNAEYCAQLGIDMLSKLKDLQPVDADQIVKQFMASIKDDPKTMYSGFYYALCSVNDKGGVMLRSPNTLVIHISPNNDDVNIVECSSRKINIDRSDAIIMSTKWLVPHADSNIINKMIISPKKVLSKIPSHQICTVVEMENFSVATYDNMGQTTVERKEYVAKPGNRNKIWSLNKIKNS